jgi:hypothetical protein
VAENFGTSFRLTDSRYFVIEADEYDTAYFDKGPKMWHYLPDTAIVNNIEFDHADIYRDEEAYKLAFARFINLIPGNGRLVAGWDSPIVRALAAKSLAPVESFGYGAGTDEVRWRALNVEFGRVQRAQLPGGHRGLRCRGCRPGRRARGVAQLPERAPSTGAARHRARRNRDRRLCPPPDGRARDH